MKAHLVMLMIFSLVVSQVSANDLLQGRVVEVIDGNTLVVETATEGRMKVMLFGIDCPELGQEYGEKARQFTEKLVLGKEVMITLQGKDRWGNRFAVVRLVKGDKDPRVDLLKEGLAWTAEKNPDPILDAHRLTAQDKGRGLWKEENPTPPWTYRRQQTMTEAKSS